MNQSNKSIQILNHNECKQQVPTEIAMNESNKSIQIQNHNECKQQVPTEMTWTPLEVHLKTKTPMKYCQVIVLMTQQVKMQVSWAQRTQKEMVIP